MASLTTYLLVSNPDDLDAAQNHSIIEKEGFELQRRWDGDGDEAPALKFVMTTPLEERPDLERPCRKLSSAFPHATIIYCEIEERFNQIDHLQTVIFIDGCRAGEFEQGYILNVGS